jgi:hypothetical protein
MASHPSNVSADEPRPRFAGRGLFGAALALTGVVLLFLGWWGVSGQPTIGEQMPYLASGTIPGAALLIAAALVLTSESSQGHAQRTDALVAELHSLLVEETPATPRVPTVGEHDEPGVVVALPAGEHYHRSGCALVIGKAGIEPLDADAIERRHLTACSVCEPDRPET